MMKLLVLSLVALGTAAGCNEKRSKEPEPAVSKPKQVAATPVVVVPESVKGKWKAVRLEVADKKSLRQQVYTIGIGEEFKLPDSELTLKVEHFLPHFVMEGTVLTSQSNELINPAAQLSIRERGQEIYKGWLFGLYPATHAFQHPLYGFTLVDYLPAG